MALTEEDYQLLEKYSGKKLDRPKKLELEEMKEVQTLDIDELEELLFDIL